MVHSLRKRQIDLSPKSNRFVTQVKSNNSNININNTSDINANINADNTPHMPPAEQTRIESQDEPQYSFGEPLFFDKPSETDKPRAVLGGLSTASK